MEDAHYQHALGELAESFDLFRSVNGAATTLAMLSKVTELLAISNTASAIPQTPEQLTNSFTGLRNEALLQGSIPLGAPSIDSWVSDSSLSQPQRVISRPSSSPSSSSVSSKDIGGAPIPTWASVASGCESADFNGLAALKLTAQQAAMNPATPYAGACATESANERMRTVWIAGLPSSYSLAQVSKLVPFGPVVAIHMYNNVSAEVPGRSACVIFEFAVQAKALLIEPTVLATGLILIPGKPQPLDATIYSMRAPTLARRRVKFARARLFYTVPMVEFKRDIYAIAAKCTVEFVHFYNPGEATAVFASVAIATKVLKWFEAQKSKAGNKYAGIRVAYARDFNEAPAQTMWSSFGKDGRVRRVANEKGIEGLFEGPRVGLGLCGVP